MNVKTCCLSFRSVEMSLSVFAAERIRSARVQEERLGVSLFENATVTA